MLMYHDSHPDRTPLEGYVPRHHTFCGGLRLLPSVLCVCTIVAMLMASCRKHTPLFTQAERQAADSLVLSVKDLDSLGRLQARLERQGNQLGSIVALRVWGKLLRDDSRFDEALNVHNKGLRQAEALGDTLEWLKALNNLGTDYRRLGILDLAKEYHYQARVISEEFSDTSQDARKTNVIALNGLGNIYMTLGNYARADSAFRLSLAGEKQLGSDVGEAINYANLGSIYEHRGQTDSAWAYYHRSMAFNRMAGNELGIALCHTYFGSLHEKARQYDKALTEYETAYEIMRASKDEWHALTPLIALAGLSDITNDNAAALDYLAKAKRMAEDIKSREHIASVYYLYYKHYKKQGNCHEALAAYELSMAMKDSLMDMEKMNRIQNTSLRIERNQQMKLMNEASMRLDSERRMRLVGYSVFGLVIIFLIALVGTLLYTYRMRSRNHKALKKLSLMRENFFTNITHEFRTPLTIILGLSHDMQQDKNMPDEAKEKATAIQQQGNGLLTLINQLLDISKIKSAVGAPDWHNGNINAYILMIVESYREYARSRNIDLQFICNEMLHMDFVPDYVKKVLNNLLSNAFKFTPEYGKVSVMTWRDSDRLNIDVADTGVGIDEENIDHVFEPFYQADNDKQNIGTGVGLAMVKQILAAVDGTISVESSLGHGTTFHISVPIRSKFKTQEAIKGQATDDNTRTPEMEGNVPMLPEPDTDMPTESNDDNEWRVLIIEDNKDVAAYIGSQLTEHYAISYAYDGKEGMVKALELVPDIIITDLMMPGIDGLEVCRQVRANDIVNHIPIIMVTARVTEEERIVGLEAGANVYLSKPFNSHELRTQVERLLEHQRLLRAKFGQQVAETGTPDVQRNEADQKFLNKMVATMCLLMDKHAFDMNVLAEKLCMSARQFHRKVVALTGDTPASYAMKIRMQRAMNLMDTKPGISIEEVAERCGFDHYSGFYHAFKRMFGYSPTQYRKRKEGKSFNPNVNIG